MSALRKCALLSPKLFRSFDISSSRGDLNSQSSILLHLNSLSLASHELSELAGLLVVAALVSKKPEK